MLDVYDMIGIKYVPWRSMSGEIRWREGAGEGEGEGEGECTRRSPVATSDPSCAMVRARVRASTMVKLRGERASEAGRACGGAESLAAVSQGRVSEVR